MQLDFKFELAVCLLVTAIILYMFWKLFVSILRSTVTAIILYMFQTLFASILRSSMSNSRGCY
jgi:hypothetical protein